MTNVMSDFHQ